MRLRPELLLVFRENETVENALWPEAAGEWSRIEYESMPPDRKPVRHGDNSESGYPAASRREAVELHQIRLIALLVF